MYQSYERDGVAVQDDETLSLDLYLSWGINLGTIGDDPDMLSTDMRARAEAYDLSAPTPRMPDGSPENNRTCCTSAAWAGADVRERP